MNQYIIVFSILHSGTRFIFRSLTKTEQSSDFPYDIGMIHLYPHWRKDFERKLRNDEDTAANIVPLRHPRAVLKSWKSRDMSMQDLRIFFDELAAFDFSPIYMPIDIDYKHTALENLKKKLNWDLKWDWNKYYIKSKTNPNLVLTDEDELFIEETFNTVPILHEYYS